MTEGPAVAEDAAPPLASSATRLRFGFFLTPDATNAAQTLELATTADNLGLDLIGIQDHPYQRRFLDTFELLAHIAGRTDNIRLAPDVANLPLRPPAMLAKSAATIDVLSNGRFELGLGAGAFWDAIEGMGGPRRGAGESVDALAEAIELIRLIWRATGHEPVTYRGEHYATNGYKPGPPPAHPIGIWLGAYGPRMVRLTGRVADGWLPSVPLLPLEEIPKRQKMIDEAAERAGRDPASVRRIANVHGQVTDGPSAGFLDGPPRQWVDDLRRLSDDYRFDTFIFWGDGDPADQLRRFAEEVAPALRAS